MTGTAGQLYGDCLDALTGLVATLDDQQLRTRVPATPRWDVRTVVAHLAGGSSDLASGRTDGAPGPNWTARHVAERSAIPLPHLIDELRSHQGQMAVIADTTTPSLPWDISVHLSDLYEALGLGEPDESSWLPVLEAASDRLLSGLPVRIQAGAAAWGAGPEIVELSAYELYRSLFSRRSRAQMRAWGAPQLDDEALAAMCAFGPREDDQPVPSSVASST
ncbi:MAG: maleylpyruvate isomerase N-terminal domain-containing protein [Nocardioides sp.]|nr:maleylpyruvate isomerase N-terminal domain-containing protein [Nocardioides sp.]